MKKPNYSFCNAAPLVTLVDFRPGFFYDFNRVQNEKIRSIGADVAGTLKIS